MKSLIVEQGAASLPVILYLSTDPTERGMQRGAMQKRDIESRKSGQITKESYERKIITRKLNDYRVHISCADTIVRGRQDEALFTLPSPEQLCSSSVILQHHLRPLMGQGTQRL